MGWIWSAAFQGYGEPWRRQRKLFHQGLQSEAARAYLPIQRQTTFRLLANLLNSPHDFPEHMKQYVSALYLMHSNNAKLCVETLGRDGPAGIIWV